MDFDLSKENIQPLRGGRNITQLEVALEAQNNSELQRELLQQKQEFENLIRTNSGEDPLDAWYRYTSWIEQSYPKHGHEGNLLPLLEECLGKFEFDPRYTNDRRFCRLWIKYIDFQTNPLELYHMMHSKNLCIGCADLYRAWAYYYEASGDFQNANRILEMGMKNLAQPYDELENAHKNLIMAAGQHVIWGSDERRLVERRQALTTLHTYKPGKVASVRTVMQSGPGIVQITNENRNGNVAPLTPYEDRGEETRGAEAGPISIIAVAKRQEMPKENTLKPGPWTTVPVKKRHLAAKTTPSFTVHEDGVNSPVIQNSFPKFTCEKYEGWNVSLTIDEPKDDRIRMYPKSKVYGDVGVEYSIEELRARRYVSSRNSVIKKVGLQSSINNENSLDKSNSFTANKEPIEFEIFTDLRDTSPPLLQIASASPATPVVASVAKTDEASQFDIWNSPTVTAPVAPPPPAHAPPNQPKFLIYEQSSIANQERIEPKAKRFCPNPGSAMKTPFKILTAEELAETGSRGGMDTGAAAQPVDSAKRLPTFDYDDEDYGGSPEKIKISNTYNEDLTCNTQMFNFNLNAMQVSTPQPKQKDQMVVVASSDEEDVEAVPRGSCKQLFAEDDEKRDKKALWTIFEETKSDGSGSSSTTKSSLFSNHTKPNPSNNMATISEEHHSNLQQNLMANAALRSELLGSIMDYDSSTTSTAQNKVADVTMENSATCNSRPTTPIRSGPTKPLDHIPSDPFKASLINMLLQRIQFPDCYTKGYQYLMHIPKLMPKKDVIVIGSDRYMVEKQLAKGTFGTVFRGFDLSTNRTVALKHQKQANKWEFYICRELQIRLADHPLKHRFMDVKIGYFNDTSSILVSDYMRCGSLLDVTNAVKQKSGRSMKESLCIYFCIDMLKVVRAMHDVKIIHADIKPDNFLVHLTGDGQVELQLIDFGCSIDMSLFPAGAAFTRRVTTDHFVCCEMKDGRPWNYHTDLFCVAATAHVLIFDKYIELKKSDGLWSITQRLPRYLRIDLWNMFFSSLLNQQSGPANAANLQQMLEESLRTKLDDFHLDMRYLINILRNR